jgi:gluconolactonase
MAELRVMAGGLDHPEGLAWDPRGSIVAGGEAGQLYRVDPDAGSVTEIANGKGYVLGIALDGDGRIYWCDQVHHAVMRHDPTSGVTEAWSRGAPDVPFRVPNSLVFDAQGRLYVSESGSWPDRDGALFIVEPDGTTRLGSTECRDFANGVAIDPPGEYLYVVETSGPSLARFAIGPDGSLASRELVTSLERTVPDGLAFASDGRLLISCFRPDAVLVWDGVGVATLAEDWMGLTLSAPTNIAFFGDDLRRLAAANIAFQHLAEIVVDMRGAPLRYPVLRA